MAGADVVVGWVDKDGQATLVDAHGDARGGFAKDKTQDYQLVVGYEYQGGTVLRFKRKLQTCDGEDLVITVSGMLEHRTINTNSFSPFLPIRVIPSASFGFTPRWTRSPASIPCRVYARNARAGGACT